MGKAAFEDVYREKKEQFEAAWKPLSISILYVKH